MIIDVTLPLTPSTPPFPGDPPFSFEFLRSVEQGDPFTLSRVISTPHVGTHVDAPSHVLAGGSTIEALPIETFLGRCRVVQVKERRIEPHHVPRGEIRVLFKTRRPGSRVEEKGGCWISPEGARRIVEEGVRLVGIDTLSVDPLDSLESHSILLQGGVAILEGLELGVVEEGVFELVALPLRWVGLKGSPVRAILRR